MIVLLLDYWIDFNDVGSLRKRSILGPIPTFRCNSRNARKVRLFACELIAYDMTQCFFKWVIFFCEKIILKRLMTMVCSHAKRISTFGTSAKNWRNHISFEGWWRKSNFFFEKQLKNRNLIAQIWVFPFFHAR